MKLSRQEIKFLEGPQSRWDDFSFTLRTLFQLVRGFRSLHFIGPCITVFGSARFKEDHEYYKITRLLAAEIAKLGFTILTGGGPGLMEAANRGAKDVGGKSVGCNIRLAEEQAQNSYLDKWVTINHFFIRKILLVKYSYAFIVMPGGFGTLDEYFEALTLIQTRKIENFPVVLFNLEYHQRLIDHIKFMQDKLAIGEKDRHLFLITDSVEETVQLIKVKCIKGFKLLPKQKRLKWLFEKD